MGRNAALSAAALGASLVLGDGIARADDDQARTPWDRGRIALSLSIGSEEAFADDYLLVGAGVGYFVLDGLEIGLDGVRWFGGDPGISVVSPGLRYVAVPLGWPVLPYAGGFYTHYFIGAPFEDFDTVGARVGLVLHRGGGLVLGVGGVAERIVSDCDEGCTSLYPELSIGFTF
jgi:hypothetical protein